MHRERALPGLGADLDGLQLECCSYCIVPSVRGREASAAGRARSSPRSTRLARDGRAGADAARPERQLLRARPAARRPHEFGELLRACDAVDGIERIRFTSPHPKDFRAPVIAAMAECAVGLRARAPAAAVGLDAACSRRCGARTTRERYLRARRRAARRRSPTSRSTTDLIVGFPGETEADFERDARGRRGGRATTAPSRSSTRRVPGTEAAAMPDQVPEDVKRERIERLVEVVQRVAARAQRASASAASRRCSSRARAAPTRRSCAAARAATRPSTSPATAAPGELVDGADRGRDLDDARAARSSPPLPRNGPRSRLGRLSQRPRARRAADRGRRRDALRRDRPRRQRPPAERRRAGRRSSTTASAR